MLCKVKTVLSNVCVASDRVSCFSLHFKMFLFRRINLLLLSFNLLNSVECGIPLYFEYDGDSWTTNWTHSNRKKGDKIVDDWVDTDLKVEYIKAEEWPASLTASEKDWEFVRKVTGEVMSIVRKVNCV